MAALPTTLDTLRTTSRQDLQIILQLKTSPDDNLDTILLPERPTDLIIDSSTSNSQTLLQQQQQHSNVTPNSSLTSLSLHGNISPALSTTSSTGGSLSPSFLPEMPQWKRDLIQRRKQNVQRTLNASASPTSSATAPSILSSSPSSQSLMAANGGGLKTSISSSSVRSLAGSITNIDQLTASDGLQISSTKDYTAKNSSSLSLSTSSSSLSANSRRNTKQFIATTTATTTKTSSGIDIEKPALRNIKSSTAKTPSPLKEKAERLFGGQYTATSTTKSSLLTSSSLSATAAATSINQLATKELYEEEVVEEIFSEKLLRAEEISVKMEESIKQEQHTKELDLEEKLQQEQDREFNDEMATSKQTATPTTTSTAIITNKQQMMATRLTGSTNTYSSSSSSTTSSTPSSMLSSTLTKRAETERGEHNNGQSLYVLNNHSHVIGANVNLENQSLNKCESERLVCAANSEITGNTSSNHLNKTGNSSLYLQNLNSNNTNNSVTIGGISSVSGNNQNINLNNSGNNTNTTTSVVKISQKLQENHFIKNEQHLGTKKIIKFKQSSSSSIVDNNYQQQQQKSLDLKSPTKSLTTSNSFGSLAAGTSLSSLSTSSSSNCLIKKKMVAVQEMKTQNTATTHLQKISTSSICHNTNNTQRNNNRQNNGGGGGGGVGGVNEGSDLDTNEDLSYGPGIVSKLRCRYLSLALRESMEQQRLNKDQLRRSTSLNNLLDNTEDEENCEEDDFEEEEEQAEIYASNKEDEDIENQFNSRQTLQGNKEASSLNSKKSGILKSSLNTKPEKRFSSNTQGSNGVGVTFTETSYNKRSRHLKRGNDSLKRARSVEALLSEKSPWHTRNNNSNTSSVITIEDKIHNARERLHQGTDHLPPKRLTSIIDDTERPPPDLVKQTLKMFEASANRRPRTTSRSNSKGEVASKVETFKNIIKEQKPLVTYPKPLSPTKKLNLSQKPLKSSTPQANDLLQSPLGRKTLATASSVVNSNTPECLTPLRATNNSHNILSDHTPDIIPRQKLPNERDFKSQLNSKRDTEAPTPLSHVKRDFIKEKFEVDSPLTALTKELSKLKINDSTPTRKIDNNSSSDNLDHGGNVVMNVGGGVGVGAGDNNADDLYQSHNNKYQHMNINNETKEIQQESSSATNNSHSSLLRNENDKIINNKTKQSQQQNEKATATTTASGVCSNSKTIETKNEAAVNNYDCLTKASSTAASPPPSSSDLSDGGDVEDDDEETAKEYGNSKTTKRITRTALDNIAKAGYSQQFKFNTSTSSSNSSPLNTVKQVGVIKPLQQQQQQKSLDTSMDSLKHSTPTSLTSREIEKNRINDLKKSSPNAASTPPSSHTSTGKVNSPSSASHDHEVIKPSHTSSPALANAAASGLSDADSVISATNSPLWAMRKRRQTPPAAPAENTSMVFNFSNRKEVPDYIENDGVIFRRKRELPKPNESGFVLLGDLSVETSTDMDYDDFSMCPPSPCDVEFVNANIVIDGKSSIRQKSKDATFRVQFNDTLTSTFEYPSEASLILDESYRAYNESYTQPLDGEEDEEFKQQFRNLCLESAAAASHHHVADEIIQLPTLNAATPATNASSNTPTKNILGNLPLGSAPLGFYTPLKAPIDSRLFQLGVTRAPSLLGSSDYLLTSPTEPTTTGVVGLFNGDGDSNGSILGISGGLIDDDDYDLNTKKTQGEQEEQPESLPYNLKPAEDDLNMAYSEGTQKTDLLY